MGERRGRERGEEGGRGGKREGGRERGEEGGRGGKREGEGGKRKGERWEGGKSLPYMSLQIAKDFYISNYYVLHVTSIDFAEGH